MTENEYNFIQTLIEIMKILALTHGFENVESFLESRCCFSPSFARKAVTSILAHSFLAIEETILMWTNYRACKSFRTITSTKLKWRELNPEQKIKVFRYYKRIDERIKHACQLVSRECSIQELVSKIFRISSNWFIEKSEVKLEN